MFLLRTKNGSVSQFWDHFDVFGTIFGSLEKLLGSPERTILEPLFLRMIMCINLPA